MFRRLEKYSWNEHYALTAINKQMQLCPMDVERENGNFEDGVLLKAFSWRQQRFFSHYQKDQVMWLRLF